MAICNYCDGKGYIWEGFGNKNRIKRKCPKCQEGYKTKLTFDTDPRSSNAKNPRTSISKSDKKKVLFQKRTRI